MKSVNIQYIKDDLLGQKESSGWMNMKTKIEKKITGEGEGGN